MRKVLASLLLLPGIVSAGSWCDCLHGVYGGFRYSMRNMDYKSQYGQNMFEKNLPQYTIFGGYQFNKCFGAELALFTTEKKSRNVTINDGATELGVPDFSGLGNDSYNTNTKFSGGTLQAVAKCPLWKCLSVYGSVGVGVGKAKWQANMTANDGIPATATQQTNNRIDQSTTRAYPVAGLGLDWRIFKWIGARADLGWEGTQFFKKNFQTPAGAPNTYQIKAKNSFLYGVSVYLAM